MLMILICVLIFVVSSLVVGSYFSGTMDDSLATAIGALSGILSLAIFFAILGFIYGFNTPVTSIGF